MLLRQYKNTIYLKNNRRYSYFFLFFNDSFCLSSRGFAVCMLSIGHSELSVGHSALPVGLLEISTGHS